MKYEGKIITINNPYENGGLLSLKGQLHCHTTNSDGTHTPAFLVGAYRDAGYDFITITDHNVVTSNPGGVAGITWLCDSVEESLGKHVSVYDVTTHYATSALVQDVINFHKYNRSMCSIAHPDYAPTLVNKDELKGYHDYNFLEIYNPIGTTNNEGYWDEVLSIGVKTFALAVDDCHTIPDHFNKGWVVVFADEDNATSIKKSLRDGNFYASSGNDIAINVVGNIIAVSSAASSDFSFIGKDGRVLQTNNGVTTANYTIIGDEKYIRVRSVKASDLTIAWSQPIFLDTNDHKVPYESPLKSTSNATYYVRPDGSDGNDGTTNDSAHAFKTIARAISKITRIVDHVFTINIGVGDYAENVLLSGYSGKGRIDLIGDSTVSTSRSIQNLKIENIPMYLRAYGLNFTTTSTASITVLACPWVYVEDCNMVQEAASQQGLSLNYNSGVWLKTSVISNKNMGIYAGAMSNVYSDTNSGTGNATGMFANIGSTIVKNGAQPGGITPQTVETGGVIR